MTISEPSATVAPEVSSDGRTVWINSFDGMCLGRFSRAGIDIHKDFEGQKSGGQCLDCKKGPTTAGDWMQFVAGMKRFHGVQVGNEHRPHFLTAAP